LLLSVFERYAPAAVLIELYPFGRRPFRFELLPLLEAAAARRPRPAALCSVRDILVSKADPSRTAEVVDIVRRHFDAVLVHGDSKLIEFGATFAAADRIADRLRYTGYVVSEAQSVAHPVHSGEILVSAGGGAVGGPLLRAALAARPLTRLAQHPWRIITGPNLPETEFAGLAAHVAGGKVTIERFRADFQSLLRNCRLSVSQAGYNTVMELLAAGSRAVVVPFAEGGETEQPIRARLLAARGFLAVVEPEELTPERLAAAIETTDQAPRPKASFDMFGADETARIVLETIERIARRKE
jgi:predicted glycosyltransferase